MQLGIIGSSGLVGSELLSLLPEARAISRVHKEDFRNLDVAFFCASTTVSQEFVPLALEAGCLVIDSSSAFRQDPQVPLVIPEINGHLLEKNPQLIASPNCTASLMLMPLYPLHKAFGIERVIASSYQAASGAGKKGIEALHSPLKVAPFPHPLHENLFLHESPQDQNGFSEEERKVVFEIGKILETHFPIHIRCVRVPVERAHSISLHIVLQKSASRETINQALATMPGLQITPSPNPLDASHTDPVWTTPARLDPADPSILSLFVVGDQLRKGAALNAYQIYRQTTSLSTFQHS